jgi:hypothetical protein
VQKPAATPSCIFATCPVRHRDGRGRLSFSYELTKRPGGKVVGANLERMEKARWQAATRSSPKGVDMLSLTMGQENAAKQLYAFCVELLPPQDR